MSVAGDLDRLDWTLVQLCLEGRAQYAAHMDPWGVRKGQHA
jgi:hypothetical protein